MPNNLFKLKNHVKKLHDCKACPKMIGPVVSGPAILSKVILVGQAPGPREGEFGKPFAWTAGKTLFKWMDECGQSEENFREKVYMAAVCRCFPGKNPKGGDRVPNETEILNCSSWFEKECSLLEPGLIIPVGKLAISQFLSFKKLTEVVGSSHQVKLKHGTVDLIPLPHPSGASTWHRTEPGIGLLKKAFGLVKKHPCWKNL
jgi:uracil-DNA glycosylase